MSFPRPDYRTLSRYDPERSPVEVDLSDNTNLWGAHPEALEIVRGAGDDDLARYPELYAGNLREVAARHLGVPSDLICTGCGSDDLLDAAWRACAEDGGVVRYAAPTFSMVEPFSRMNGRIPKAVGWSGALADPSRLLEDDPVLVYVCRPNNPTGHQAPLAWLERLIDDAAALPGGGPLVVVDEAYADFAGESYAHRAVERDRVLVTRTMSKAYGLAGLRVGFGTGSREVVDEVEKARGPYKVNRVAGEATCAALADDSGWAAARIEETLENRERLAEALRRRGLPPLPSATNFLFLEVPEGQARAAARALREHGVAVRPFTGEADVGDGLRVSVGPWTMMEAFLSALDAVLESEASPLAALHGDGSGGGSRRAAPAGGEPRTGAGRAGGSDRAPGGAA